MSNENKTTSITDTNIAYGDLLAYLVKFTLAAVPAVLFATALIGIITLVAAAFFSAFVKVFTIS